MTDKLYQPPIEGLADMPVAVQAHLVYGEAMASTDEAVRIAAIGNVALLYGLNIEVPEDRETLAHKINRLAALAISAESADYDPVRYVSALEQACDLIYLGRREIAHTVALERLSQLAFHDPLTGAQNRNGEDRIVNRWLEPSSHRRRQEEGESQRRDGRTILSFDLTNFKQINDVLGYDIGDQALVEAVNEMRELTRAEDLAEVVRVGGDEFRIYIGYMRQLNFRGLLRRAQTDQANKTTGQRSEEAWRRIQFLKGTLKGAGLPFIPEIRLADPDNPESRRVLCINGRPFMPFRDLVVWSVGGARGGFRSTKGYKALIQRAKRSEERHKERLHETMGGAYRLGSRAVEVGELEIDERTLYIRGGFDLSHERPTDDGQLRRRGDDAS